MQHVHLELQRVHTWLFALPQLRAMVEANASRLIDQTKLKALQCSQEFKVLAGNGYLPHVHADSNDVGSVIGTDKLSDTTLQPYQRALHTRLFVRWMCSQIRQEAQ